MNLRQSTDIAGALRLEARRSFRKGSYTYRRSRVTRFSGVAAGSVGTSFRSGAAQLATFRLATAIHGPVFDVRRRRIRDRAVYRAPGIRAGGEQLAQEPPESTFPLV